MAMKERSFGPKAHRTVCAFAGAALMVGATLGAGLGIAGTLDSNSIVNKDMDVVAAYSESYFTAADDSVMGAHRNLGLTCISCHPMSDGTPPDAIESASGAQETCMTTGCHDNWGAIVEATSDCMGTPTVYNPSGVYNPHSNHRSPADCGECHKMHTVQTLTCAQCHKVDMPTGWAGFY